jgi:hypothetical protein
VEWLIFIIGLGVGLVGWVTGIATSAFLQDREYYRKQRGLIAALGTDLVRIREELGGTDERRPDIVSGPFPSRRPLRRAGGARQGSPRYLARCPMTA